MTKVKPTRNYKRRVLADFGPRQQDFLLKACSQGVPLDDPLATDTRVGQLEGAGLIHRRTSKKGRTSWRLTDAGRGVVSGHVPTFLHRRGFPSYTHQQHRAMLGEPEVIRDAA